MVPRTGLEPARVAPLAPQASVSANSTTSAYSFLDEYSGYATLLSMINQTVPIVMGILNITPDSFFDGGSYLDADHALNRAKEMVAQGAGMIDVGAFSSRPGAALLTPDEEIHRLSPILENLVKACDVPISLDTMHSAVAKFGLSCGVKMINDISAMTFDSKMGSIIASFDAAVCLMHMRGLPKTMQLDSDPLLSVEDIIRYLKARVLDAQKMGIKTIWVDPGIGFGKSVDQNLKIFKHLQAFRALGCPVLVGASRKSFIGKVINDDYQDRLAGSISAVLSAYKQGVHCVRVHDVLETVQALKVCAAIENA